MDPNFVKDKQFISIHDERYDPEKQFKKIQDLFVLNLSKVESERDIYFQCGILSITTITATNNTNITHPKYLWN